MKQEGGEGGDNIVIQTDGNTISLTRNDEKEDEDNELQVALVGGNEEGKRMEEESEKNISSSSDNDNDQTEEEEEDRVVEVTNTQENGETKEKDFTAGSLGSMLMDDYSPKKEGGGKEPIQNNEDEEEEHESNNQPPSQPPMNGTQQQQGGGNEQDDDGSDPQPNFEQPSYDELNMSCQLSDHRSEKKEKERKRFTCVDGLKFLFILFSRVMAGCTAVVAMLGY